ncbi:MAG: hypothetical protein Q8Q06_02470 [bacterium]|nr:hypothetical protein [bacterium]
MDSRTGRTNKSSLSERRYELPMEPASGLLSTKIRPARGQIVLALETYGISHNVQLVPYRHND